MLRGQHLRSKDVDIKGSLGPGGRSMRSSPGGPPASLRSGQTDVRLLLLPLNLIGPRARPSWEAARARIDSVRGGRGGNGMDGTGWLGMTPTAWPQPYGMRTDRGPAGGLPGLFGLDAERWAGSFDTAERNRLHPDFSAGDRIRDRKTLHRARKLPGQTAL